VHDHNVVDPIGNQKQLEDPTSDPPRHLNEKEKLLRRLQRSQGSWTSNHPRHRLLDALHGYKAYYRRQVEELDRLRGLYKSVSKGQKSVRSLSVCKLQPHIGGLIQKQLLEKQVHYSHKFSLIDKLLAKNQDLCNRIVENALDFYDLDSAELDAHMKQAESDGRKADKIAVSQSLKHMVRDWTAAGGRYERDQCFECITSTLRSLFQDRDVVSKSTTVLLPGAGLGRLGHDIAQLDGKPDVVDVCHCV
jgi:carnosine N-methyltransferase